MRTRTPSGLMSDGKPMRALRTLECSTPANPLTEYDVYRANNGGWKLDSWHKALAALVKHGLAVRCGGRPAQWYITDAGREALR